MFCLVALMGAGVCMAQKPAEQKDQKEKKTVTTVFATDIDCDHCAQKILNNVPALGKGVKDVSVNVAKKEVTVIYDASKTNDEQIVKGLASLKVKAEPKKSAAKK